MREIKYHELDDLISSQIRQIIIESEKDNNYQDARYITLKVCAENLLEYLEEILNFTKPIRECLKNEEK